MTARHDAGLRAVTLSDDQRAQYRRDGFVKIDAFAAEEVGRRMLDRVVELAHRAADGDDIGPAFVLPEQQEDFASRGGARPEDAVSKIFRLARDDAFHDVVVDPAVTQLVGDVLHVADGGDAGADLDNFLSQFIFKNPGAWGQPWHQDSYYFPFEPARPVVGVWLAITEATLQNGCLHVLPGSHTEPVHEHVPDARPGANYGYVEIVDHDMRASVAVTMSPGDLLLFDSHLMHRSTDNESDGARAAMVFHYARAGTHDRTEALKGYTVNDWIPARRAGG